MFEILSKIIPLDLASTLSPGIFALTIILLGNKSYSMLRTLSMFFGTLLVGVGIALLGYFLGQAAPTGIKQNITSSVVDIILGSFFIIFGIKTLFLKERKIKFKEGQNPQIIKWFIVGLIISATNFDALFLSLTAAKEVGGTEINILEQIILLVVNVLFFTLPTTLPLLLTIFLPRFAHSILTSINVFVLKYSKYIVCLLFIIFGIIFIYRGIKFF